jgi:hypothetical protein
MVNKRLSENMNPSGMFFRLSLGGGVFYGSKNQLNPENREVSNG